MIAQSGLPERFWVEAIRNAVKIRNLIPRDNGVASCQQLTGKLLTSVRSDPLDASAKYNPTEREAKN
jgi:hypothetical protein